MIRLICIFICSLWLAAGIVGCTEEQVPAPQAKPKTAAKAPAKQAPKPTAAVETEEKKEEKFVYQAAGRRDPFVPLTEIRKPVTESTEPMTPLQRYELGQYRLLGVIIGKEEPRAMVKAPDGKSYILTRGLKIGKNGGTIIEINSQVIKVEEKYYDFSGNVRTNIQEIRVPKR